MYEANTATSARAKKKKQHGRFMALIDTRNAKRTWGLCVLGSSGPAEVPGNADKNEIYRMVARYRATVSKDKTIYRR